MSLQTTNTVKRSVRLSCLSTFLYKVRFNFCHVHEDGEVGKIKNIIAMETSSQVLDIILQDPKQDSLLKALFIYSFIQTFSDL